MIMSFLYLHFCTLAQSRDWGSKESGYSFGNKVSGFCGRDLVCKPEITACSAKFKPMNSVIF